MIEHVAHVQYVLAVGNSTCLKGIENKEQLFLSFSDLMKQTVLKQYLWEASILMLRVWVAKVAIHPKVVLHYCCHSQAE